MTETFNAAAFFVDRHVDEGRGESIAIECGDERIAYPRPSGVRQSIRLGAQGRAGGPAGRARPAADARRAGDGLRVLRRHQDRRRAGPAQHALDRFRLRLRPARRPRRACSSSALHCCRVWARPPSPPIPGYATSSSWAVRPLTASRSLPLLDARLADSRRGANEPRRGGVLAVFVGQHRPSQGLRPPAARHARVRGDLRAGHPAASDRADRCFSVAKLFFAYGLGNGMYFPFSVGATTILWPGAVTPAVVCGLIERYRPTLFFSVPTHYAMLLAHREEGREFDLSSIRLRRLGRRVAAAGDLRTLSRAVRRRDPRRHRIDGGPAHLHLQSPRRGPNRDRAARSCPATRRDSWTRLAAQFPRGEIGSPDDPRRLDLRLLLEQARADEGHDRRPLDSHRRPVLRRRAGLLFGSPAVRTTCSRSAVSGSARPSSRTRCSSTRRCRRAASWGSPTPTAWSSRPPSS